MEVESRIIDFLREQEQVTLGFSMGKDSVACAIILRDLGVKFTPFYFYHVPDLEFVNKQIEYYQDVFKTEIVQLPHPMLYDRIRHQDFQYKEVCDWLGQYKFNKMSFRKLIDFYLEENDLTDLYDVVGMRASESFNRRMFFKDYGPIHKDKIYPIYNWRQKETKEFVISKGIKLTDDYKIWDRSWDGLKYQFLFGIKKHHPEDFERIREYFPLIELELKRYEFNQSYYVDLG
jgi:3'-phosphoadenosine 5'-phosphosulfate sulfotransferase (PAPS reductase)/FAD synthetase